MNKIGRIIIIILKYAVNITCTKRNQKENNFHRNLSFLQRNAANFSLLPNLVSSRGLRTAAGGMDTNSTRQTAFTWTMSSSTKEEKTMGRASGGVIKTVIRSSLPPLGPQALLLWRTVTGLFSLSDGHYFYVRWCGAGDVIITECDVLFVFNVSMLTV